MKLYKKILFIFLMMPMFAFSGDDIVWIDVRTEAEYQADHIEGDLNIPHVSISKVAELFPDRETEIQLYCRSGRRASFAMEALNKLGYQNVSNSGGIEDARRERDLL